MRIGALFAGLGGLDLACEWAWSGSSVAWQTDLLGERVRARHWPEARQIVGDVRTLRGADVERVDVLCGGFPCQDLSCAGQGAGLDGERSGLYREVVRLAREIGPQYVVLENVSGLRRYLPLLVADWRGLGYGLSWCLCEAADAGAPHLRRRIFVLAERGAPSRGEVEADTRGRWRGEARTWGTPRVGNCGRGSEREDDRSRIEDQVQVRPWPTVTEHGNDNVQGLSPTSGDGLATAVRPWPTIMARNSPAPMVRGNDSIASAVRPWPTVVGRDSKSGDLPDRVGTEALSSAAGASGLGAWGRRLRPEWCETLMGLPQGWTLPEGPRLVAEPSPRWPRGRYPASWDRSVEWPGYEWEPSRTIPDGPPCPGRPARIRALGNAVVPQQAALALRALLGQSAQQALFGRR